MRYFVVFVFLLFSSVTFSQVGVETSVVSGTIINDNTKLPISNVNVININKVIGSVSDDKGFFEMKVSVSDTLIFSYIGFQTLKVRVTKDWIKNKTSQFQ